MTLEEISNRYTIPQNVEALKAILANPRAWKAVDEMFIKTVNELAGRDTLTSDGGKLYLRHGHNMTVKGSGNTRTLVISGAEMASVANIETFITDPSNDYYEVKRAKEDYYLDYLMSCKTGQYILTTRFKLYIKKSAVEVHELHTRTMAIHDYNVTFE